MTFCPIVVPVGTHKMKIDDSARTFYRDVAHRLTEAGIPFLVGGAFALSKYCGVSRDTKDLDLFIRPKEWERVVGVLENHGYVVELTFSHWLGKVRNGTHYVDFIFDSGNGLTPVDDTWFSHARDGDLLGYPVKLVPPEECVWSKCFVMERERFDGADVAHLLRSCGSALDWTRLMHRFGDKWRVLLSHLVMFGFIYPGERDSVPAWVMRDLTERVAEELDDAPHDVRCRGTLISRAQYLVDIDQWGYHDARLKMEGGGMTEAQVAAWTDAINKVD